jgi:hypothetical protein
MANVYCTPDLSMIEAFIEKRSFIKKEKPDCSFNHLVIDREVVILMEEISMSLLLLQC